MAGRRRLPVNAMGHVLGFTMIFVLLGSAFGAAGSLLNSREP